MNNSKPLTVRVPADLFDRANTWATVSGMPLREIVATGMERQLREMSREGGSEFESAIDAVRRYRESVKGA